MDEVKSAGGPLICVESRLSHEWRGIEGLSVKPDVSMVGISTDYERAYRGPNNYLTVLPLIHGTALILGEMPLVTGVWKNSLNQIVLWRIFYAEQDDDVPGMLASLPEETFETSLQSIELSFGSRNVVIFDSALPGDEAQAESISFKIAPGKYVVTTHVAKPTPSAELLLHRFYPIK
jgi:immunity protein 21 of polymorphic toxin system